MFENNKIGDKLNYRAVWKDSGEEVERELIVYLINKNFIYAKETPPEGSFFYGAKFLKHKFNINDGTEVENNNYKNGRCYEWK